MDAATRVSGRPSDRGSEWLFDLAPTERLEAGEVLDDDEPRIGELELESPVGQRLSRKTQVGVKDRQVEPSGAALLSRYANGADPAYLQQRPGLADPKSL